MLGFGLSERPERFDYSPEAHSRALAAFVDRLGLEDFTLVVHDFGGPVGLPLALERPERVRRLVVLSAPFAHDGWWPEVEASFATFTPDVFKGTPIQQQYDSLGNDPAHFPDFVKKVISIDLKPFPERQLTADQVIAGLRRKTVDVTGVRVFLTNPPAIRIGGQNTRSLYQYTLQSVDTAALPVLIRTGTGNEAVEAELLEAGADDYLDKSVDATRFVARVKAVLRRSAL
jgi:pimeloyl-ACP methyl ester carboxylesterase